MHCIAALSSRATTGFMLKCNVTLLRVSGHLQCSENVVCQHHFRQGASLSLHGTNYAQKAAKTSKALVVTYFGSHLDQPRLEWSQVVWFGLYSRHVCFPCSLIAETQKPFALSPKNSAKIKSTHQAMPQAAMTGFQPADSHSGPQAGVSAHEAIQYWYMRAHRALKQRWSDASQMLREYQHVDALDDNIEHTAKAAKSKAASGRNRYCNVLPFDHNRVVLADKQYINASLVQVQLPMLSRPCSYIATQGPLPGTAADFWRMVYELKVAAIVMLTNVNECGINKCAQYFPAQANGRVNMPGFKLQVDQVVPFSPDCTLRAMRLSSNTGDGSHTLSHYHFHAWPDHGTPDSSEGIRAICRSLSPARESGAPVLVHCSAGIGRTGTFCSIDILLQRLAAWPQCENGSGPDRGEVEAALNIPNLVHELRRQRMGMVQTLEQYAFVYKAIVDDLQERLQRLQQ